MRRVVVIVALAIGLVALALGCNALFGVTDYVVSDDAAATDGPKPDGPVDCNVDPATGQCYPCAPTVDIQYLNACTNAQCVPFDDKQRVPLLPADGKLPPAPDPPPPPPPSDAGNG